MEITFLGATGTVTGSKYLLSCEQEKFLVDCGLFQGYKELRLRNWEKFSFNPREIKAVLLTHAHIDHSGCIPLLVKNGFKGSIYASEATEDLCKILLPDCGFLQEEDARRANKYGYSKHKPALPLYTEQDAEIALKQFKSVDFGKPYPLVKEGSVTWHRAGHILGASFVEVNCEGRRLVFSGDIGRLDDPVMKTPVTLQAADYLVLESTYGNRLHGDSNPMDQLEAVVKDTVKRGGSLLIASFAVGRAQSILYYLSQLKQQKRIPDVPIYLDSPMAVDATELLHRHHAEHKLTREQCQETCRVAKYVNTPEESKTLDEKGSAKIIISASGMMTGGRILHHLAFYGRDSRNTLLITGYQAGGTRGERILSGIKEIKIHGEMVPINAHVEYLNNMSAHADYSEILTWLKGFTQPPRKVFITHGEPEAALALKGHIESELGWSCHVPEYLEKVRL